MRERNRNREGRNGLRNECRQLPINQNDWCLPVLCPTTCLTLEVTISRHSSIFPWFHSLALQWRSIIAAVLAACRSLGPCHGNPCAAIKRTQQLNGRHRKEQSLSNTSAPQTQSSAKVAHGPKADTLGCFFLSEKFANKHWFLKSYTVCTHEVYPVGPDVSALLNAHIRVDSQ